jgi:hypothetical protein
MLLETSNESNSDVVNKFRLCDTNAMSMPINTNISECRNGLDMISLFDVYGYLNVLLLCL